MRRHKKTVLTGFIFALAVTVFPPLPAYAAVNPACSDPEEVIFVSDYVAFISTATRGTYTETMIRNSGIDQSCNDGRDYSLKWGTAHSLAANGSDFVEVGWDTTWFVDFGTQYWRVFWEYSIGNQAKDEKIEVACCATSAFKTYNVSGTSWKGFYDRNADGTIDFTFGPVSIPNMTLASPLAEAGRRAGGSDYDHHNNLKYRDSNGIWHPWSTGISEVYDHDYGYHCHQDSVTEFQFHMPDTRHPTGSANWCRI